jgi:signal transduction histidine kinase
MPTQRKRTAEPERVRTDKSLRTERDQADQAFNERQAAVETEADEIVDRAREEADAVLLAARDKADQKLDKGPAVAVARAALAGERAVEDEVLRGERASADTVLRQQREESARALARLLPLEREQTDRFLLTERARSDDAVTYRDDFLGIVSHDLRNLLGGIVLSAGLLADTAPEDESGREVLAGTARIQRYAARMNRLIGDLIDVASIDAGHLAVTLAPGDLGALVIEASETFQAAAAAKSLTIATEIVGAPLLGQLDHGRIFQVLVNLISNAIKFTARGGAISIRAAPVEGSLALTVEDTGIGIPADMLEQVFERFWQVGPGDRRGSGLGLYISRCIIGAHGGKIWAESEPGRGSRFTFTLPHAGAIAKPAASA